MAVTLSNRVRLTKSGVFVRDDPGLGLLAYVPFTGLIYAVHPSEAPEVHAWLSRDTAAAPSEVYRRSLGAGWAIPADKAKHPNNHLLPGTEAWSSLPAPESPILVNWLITGRCPLGLQILLRRGSHAQRRP